MALTVVAGQTPAAGHTLHATGEVVSGLSHTHGGHTHVHLGGAGQLDERDVVVDAVAVVAGVLEHLTGSDMVMSGKHTGGRRDETRSCCCLSPTLPTFITWMSSSLEERSCSPRITRWDVLQGQGQKHEAAILCLKVTAGGALCSCRAVSSSLISSNKEEFWFGVDSGTRCGQKWKCFHI